MDEELQAELIRRMEADAAAVRGFLASADSYRDAFIRQPEAQSTIPWPYVALDWNGLPRRQRPRRYGEC
jgi:hypothetical protein